MPGPAAPALPSRRQWSGARAGASRAEPPAPRGSPAPAGVGCACSGAAERPVGPHRTRPYAGSPAAPAPGGRAGPAPGTNRVRAGGHAASERVCVEIRPPLLSSPGMTALWPPWPSAVRRGPDASCRRGLRRPRPRRSYAERLRHGHGRWSTPTRVRPGLTRPRRGSQHPRRGGVWPCGPHLVVAD